MYQERLGQAGPNMDQVKDAEIDYSDIQPLDKSFFTKAAET
jgi:hypothetical protein